LKETNQILSQIKRAEYAPVYLLMGTEPYFINQVSNALIENVVDETARDFDLTIMYGKESHPDQIIEAAKRFPMLVKNQLIVVKEAQYLDRTLEL
jgi:DNA polymerase-3 subunit delta